MTTTPATERVRALPRGSTLATVIVPLARISTVVLFAVAPAVGLLALLWVARDSLAVDMHHAFRPAAAAVLAGDSPYPPPTVESIAGRDAFVYLPLAAIMFTPFALVPPLAADLLATAAVILMAAAALWILGVRDWRCYGIALASMQVFSAIQNANLTLPLLLALAVVWVTRRRTVTPGVVLALTLATKLFLWPMLVWLLATRRYGSMLVAAGSSAVLVLGSWAAISFAGVREFPSLMRVLTKTLGSDSYTVFAVASDLGVGELPARLLGLAVATAVLGACWLLGRRGDDARSFTLAILATLLFSPIVWLHYFALLFVPVAIVHRRLSYLWVAPLVLWVYGDPFDNGTTLETVLTLLSMTVLVGLILGEARQGAAARLGDTRRALNGSLATGSPNA